MIPEVPSSRFVKNAEVRREEKNIKNRGRSKNITFQYSAEGGNGRKKGVLHRGGVEVAQTADSEP